MQLVWIHQVEVAPLKNLVVHHADSTAVILLIICCEILFTITNITMLNNKDFDFFDSCASLCHNLKCVNFLYTNTLTYQC